jgi:hypothetical protein
LYRTLAAHRVSKRARWPLSCDEAFFLRIEVTRQMRMWPFVKKAKPMGFLAISRHQEKCFTVL